MFKHDQTQRKLPVINKKCILKINKLRSGEYLRLYIYFNFFQLKSLILVKNNVATDTELIIIKRGKMEKIIYDVLFKCKEFTDEKQ